MTKNWNLIFKSHHLVMNPAQGPTLKCAPGHNSIKDSNIIKSYWRGRGVMDSENFKPWLLAILRGGLFILVQPIWPMHQNKHSLEILILVQGQATLLGSQPSAHKEIKDSWCTRIQIARKLLFRSIAQIGCTRTKRPPFPNGPKSRFECFRVHKPSSMSVTSDDIRIFDTLMTLSTFWRGIPGLNALPDDEIEKSDVDYPNFRSLYKGTCSKYRLFDWKASPDRFPMILKLFLSDSGAISIQYLPSGTPKPLIFD